MWTQDEFEWQRQVVLHAGAQRAAETVQQPHPPMWVTVTTPGTELDAADRGLGCLGVSRGRLRRAGATHARNITGASPSATPSAAVVNDQVHTMNFLYCHEDYREARDVGVPMVNCVQHRQRASVLDPRSVPDARIPDARQRRRGDERRSRPPADDPSAAKGLARRRRRRRSRSPVRTIKRWESIGVTGINFLLNAMEMVPQQQVLDSLRLFAREVMPQFRSAAEQRRRCTRRRHCRILRLRGAAERADAVGTAELDQLCSRSVGDHRSMGHRGRRTRRCRVLPDDRRDAQRRRARRCLPAGSASDCAAGAFACRRGRRSSPWGPFSLGVHPGVVSQRRAGSRIHISGVSRSTRSGGATRCERSLRLPGFARRCRSCGADYDGVDVRVRRAGETDARRARALIPIRWMSTTCSTRAR